MRRRSNSHNPGDGVKQVRLGDYEAWVNVEGKRVTHYGIEVDEAKKVATCWIASTVGKRFEVCAQKLHRDFDCGPIIDIDGHSASSFLLEKHDLKHYGRSELLTGPSSGRPFMFAPLQLSDDDSLLNNVSSSQEIGEIKITMRRLGGLKPMEGVPVGSKYDVPDPEAVHEKSKKAMEHRVQYGSETRIQKQYVSPCKLLDVVATFIIRYRSLEMLKARGIAPQHLNQESVQVKTELSTRVSSAGPGSKRKISDAIKKEEVDDDIDSSLDQGEKRLRAELNRVRKAKKARKQEKRARGRAKREPSEDLLDFARGPA